MWPSSNQVCRVVMAAIVFWAIILSACNEPPAVNPWRDDAISVETWSTPSADGILATGQTPVIRKLDTPADPAPSVSGAVPHYPLWWEDPFEDKGDGNNTFAWTAADYVGMPYGLGRFLLNTMAWPVSAVVTPPGTPMVSDGVIGRDHDARRGVSPNPTTGSEDFRFDEALPSERAEEVSQADDAGEADK